MNCKLWTTNSNCKTNIALQKKLLEIKLQKEAARELS
jgi:hypothetical protein